MVQIKNNYKEFYKELKDFLLNEISNVSSRMGFMLSLKEKYPDLTREIDNLLDSEGKLMESIRKEVKRINEVIEKDESRREDDGFKEL
jgi:uncharacterized protein Yka (UPF0111/DUF47 family)